MKTRFFFWEGSKVSSRFSGFWSCRAKKGGILQESTFCRTCQIYFRRPLKKACIWDFSACLLVAKITLNAGTNGKYSFWCIWPLVSRRIETCVTRTRGPSWLLSVLWRFPKHPLPPFPIFSCVCCWKPFGWGIMFTITTWKRWKQDADISRTRRRASFIVCSVFPGMFLTVVLFTDAAGFVPPPAHCKIVIPRTGWIIRLWQTRAHHGFGREFLMGFFAECKGEVQDLKPKWDFLPCLNQLGVGVILRSIFLSFVLCNCHQTSWEWILEHQHTSPLVGKFNNSRCFNLRPTVPGNRHFHLLPGNGGGGNWYEFSAV